MAESIGLEAVLDMREFQSGVDRYLSQLYRLDRDTQAITGSMSASFETLGKTITLTAVVALTAFSTASAYALGRFQDFVITSVGEAALLEDELGTIAAVLQTDISAIAELRDVIEELAIDPNLKVNTFQTAEAIEILARNGQNLEAIMGGAARATIAMANATGGSFDESARVVTDIMNIFGVKANEVERIIDGATAVVNNSKFDLNDYFLALANGGAAFENVGGTIEEFNAAIIGISSAFNTGRRAGTAFSVLIQNLVPKSKVAAQVMAALGMINEQGFIKFFDNQGAFLGLANAAQVLQDALGGLSEAERVFYIRQIFGIDAQEAVIQLMKLGSEGVEELQKKIADTSAYDAAATRMQTLAGRWEIFLGILEAARVNFGFKLIPALYRGLDTLNNILQDNFDSMDKFGDAFGKLADKMVDWLIPIAQEWIPKLGDVMTQLGDYLIEVIDSGVVFNDMLDKLPAPLRRIITYVDRAVKWFGDLAFWVKRAASWLADFAGPFVAWLQANVTFEDILTAMTLAVGSFLLPLATAIIQMGAFAVAIVAAVSIIRQAWESDWGGIQEFVQEAMVKLLGIFNTTLEILTTIRNRFGPDFLTGLESAFRTIQPYALQFLNALQFILDRLLLITEGNWEVVWNEMKDGFAQLSQRIVDTFSEIDYSKLFDTLLAEVETRIAPIRTRIEEEMAKIDWKGMFDMLLAEIETRIEPIRTRIEEEMAKIDFKSMFDTLQAEIEERMAPIRAKMEEELKKVDMKGIVEAWWMRLDEAFATETDPRSLSTRMSDMMNAYWKALMGEPLSESEKELPLIKTIVVVQEKIEQLLEDLGIKKKDTSGAIDAYVKALTGGELTEQEQADFPLAARIEKVRSMIETFVNVTLPQLKLDTETAIDVYMKALTGQESDEFGNVKGATLTEEEKQKYPLAAMIEKMRNQITGTLDFIDEQTIKLKVAISEYMAAWTGTAPAPKEGQEGGGQELPLIGAVGKLGEFNRGLDEFSKSIQESEAVDWAKANIDMLDLFHGALTGLIASGLQGFPLLSLQMAAFVSLGVANSVLLRKAWETNWGGIKDFTIKTWPEIQAIGLELLGIGQQIWQALGPDLEGVVGVLLENITLNVTNVLAGLQKLADWVNGEGGTQVNDFLDELAASIDTANKNAVYFQTTGVPALVEGLGVLQDALGETKESWAGMVPDLGPISERVGFLVKFITDATTAMSAVVIHAATQVVAATSFMGDALKALPQLALGDRSGIQAAAKRFSDTMDKADKAFLDAVRPLFTTIFGDLETFGLPSEDMTKEQINKIWDGLESVQAVRQKQYEDLMAAAGVGSGQAFADGMDVPLVKLTNDIDTVGKDIIAGLTRGLEDNKQTLWDKATEVGNGLMDAWKAVMGTQSPSTKTHEIGVDTIQGMINGIEQLAPTLLASTQDLANKLLALWTKTYEEIITRTQEHNDQVENLTVTTNQAMTEEHTGFIELFMKATQDFFNGLIDLWTKSHKTLADDNKNYTDGESTLYGDHQSSLLTKFTSFVSEYLAKASSFFSELFSKASVGVATFVSAFALMGSQILARFTEMISNVIGSLSGFASQMFTTGQNIVQGFIDGIGSKIGDAAAKLAELVGISAQATATAAEIQSPSKLFERLGIMTGEGYLVGLGETFGQVAPMLSGMMRQVSAELSSVNRMVSPSVQGAPSATNYVRNNSTSVSNSANFGPFNVNNSLTVAQLRQLIRQEVNGAI